MKARTLAACAAFALWAAGAPAQAAEEAWVAEARAISMDVPPKLLAVLQAEIAKSGPEGAIAVCQVQAPALAAWARVHPQTSPAPQCVSQSAGASQRCLRNRSAGFQ